MTRSTLAVADDLANAAEWYRLNQQGQSYEEIARSYNVTRGVVAGIIHRWKERVCNYNGLPITPLHLAGDWVTVGDVHAPDTDWEWASRVSRVAQKYNIKKLAIVGDLFNMDAFSEYDASIPVATWAQERDFTRILLGDWLQTFDEIVIMMGNHDRRMQKWAGGNLDEKDIFGMVFSSPRVKTSNFGWCTLTSGGVNWRLTHPKNYSRNQLVVASDMANKYQTNIISFHEHHLSVGYDVYGHYVCVNAGTLVSPGRLAYANLDDSRSAAMVQGFAAVKSGCVMLFGAEPMTDWTCM